MMPQYDSIIPHTEINVKIEKQTAEQSFCNPVWTLPHTLTLHTLNIHKAMTTFRRLSFFAHSGGNDKEPHTITLPSCLKRTDRMSNVGLNVVSTIGTNLIPVLEPSVEKSCHNRSEACGSSCPVSEREIKQDWCLVYHVFQHLFWFLKINSTKERDGTKGADTCASVLTVVSSSCSTWSYPLSATQKIMAVTSSKQWIHFFLSDLWPPTSKSLMDKERCETTDMKIHSHSCTFEWGGLVLMSSCGQFLYHILYLSHHHNVKPAWTQCIHLCLHSAVTLHAWLIIFKLGQATSFLISKHDTQVYQILQFKVKCSVFVESL